MTILKRIGILILIFLLIFTSFAIGENKIYPDEVQNNFYSINNTRSLSNNSGNWSYLTIPGITYVKQSCKSKIAYNDPYVHILGAEGYIKSDNNGRTWTEVNHNIFGEDILISENTIYIVLKKFKERIGYEDIYDIYFRRSIDNGVTWESEMLLSKDDNTSSFSPKIALYGKYVYVIWKEKLFNETLLYYQYNISIRTSDDHGINWSDEKIIVDNSLISEIDIAVFDNVIHLVWSNHINFYSEEKDIYYQLSTNNGNTWSSKIKLNDYNKVSNGPVLGIENTNLYVFWNIMIGNYSNDKDLSFRKSNDNGITWSNIDKIENLNVGQNILPRVAIRNDVIHLIWVSGEDVNYCQSVDGGEHWTPGEVISEYHEEKNTYTNCIDIAVNESKIHVVMSTYSTTYYTNNLKNSLPDLIFFKEEITVSNNYPKLFEKVEINISIHNFGDTDANNFSIEFYRSEPYEAKERIWLEEIRFLKSGKNLTVQVTWYPNKPGDYSIYFYIDNDNNILEHNEKNNDGEMFFSVFGNWTNEFRLSQNDKVNSTKPEIVVTNNVIHTVWINEYEGYGKIIYSKSVDDGLNWTTPIELGTVSPQDYYEWDDYYLYSQLGFIGDENYLYIVWQNKINNDSDINEVYFSMSKDQGKSWTFPFMISDDDNVDSIMSSIYMCKDDIYVSWVDIENFKEKIYIRISNDNGLTWSLEKLNPYNPGNDSGVDELRVGADQNNIYLVWNGWYSDSALGPPFGSAAFTLFIKSTDGGLTWTDPIMFHYTSYTIMGSYSKLKEIEITNETIHILFKDDLLISYDFGENWTHNRTWDSYYAHASDIKVQKDKIKIIEHYDISDFSEIYLINSIDCGENWTSFRLTCNENNSENPKLGIIGTTVYIVWEDNRDDTWEIYFKWIDINFTIVKNYPPSVEIISPLPSSVVNNTITIRGTANDNHEILKVQVQIGDNNWTEAEGTIEWYYLLNTSVLLNGIYEIKARAYDGEFYSEIVNISIIVNNEEIVDIKDTDLDVEPDILDKDDDNDGVENEKDDHFEVYIIILLLITLIVLTILILTKWKKVRKPRFKSKRKE